VSHDDHDHEPASKGDDDTTLGGYFAKHDRPPAFEGIDAHPYTVSIETEKTPDLRTPWIGYLVFPRWAATGVGIVGHVETPVLWKAGSREALLDEIGHLHLFEVKTLLDEAIAARNDGPTPESPEPF
jgi:hypothetical protein